MAGTPGFLVKGALLVLVFSSVSMAGEPVSGHRIDDNPSSGDIGKLADAISLVGQIDPGKGAELEALLTAGKLKYLAFADSGHGFTNKAQGIIAAKAKGRTALQVAGVLLHELNHLHSTEITYNLSEGASGVCDVDTPILVAGLGEHGVIHEATYSDSCLMSCLLVSVGEIVDCSEVLETLYLAEAYYEQAPETAGEGYPALRDGYILEANRVQRLIGSLDEESCCCHFF